MAQSGIRSGAVTLYYELQAIRRESGMPFASSWGIVTLLVPVILFAALAPPSPLRPKARSVGLLVRRWSMNRAMWVCLALRVPRGSPGTPGRAAQRRGKVNSQRYEGVLEVTAAGIAS